MEPFEIACPHCSGKLRVGTPTLLGRTVKCPKCTNPFTVPSEEDLAGYEQAANEEVMEQEAGVGSGVGSEVGVGSGIGVGSSVGVGSGVGASLGRLGQSFDYEAEQHDISQPAEEEAVEETAEVQEESAERKPPRRSGAPAPRSAGNPRAPLPAKNLAMVIGIPAALLVFGTLFILAAKGYLTGGKDHRQDGSRFQDFARDAEKNAKWVPQYDPRNSKGRFND